MLRWLWVSVLVVIADQATKALATAHLTFGEPVPLVPFVNLTLLHNTGAAFSFLSGAGGWQRWFFVGLALAVSGAILLWLRKLHLNQSLLAAALALVLGGALGNLWDRVSLGYVVDFIDLYYGHWHWPAFNVADTAITVGAALLILDSFRRHGDVVAEERGRQ